MFRCKPSRGSKTLALAAAVVVQLTGCSSESNTSGPSVSRITVVNKTTFVVRDLTVSGLGKPMQFRPISGGSDSALSPSDPRPTQALNVEWTDHNDQTRAIKVNVRKRFGDDYRGGITLTFRRDGVLEPSSG